MRNRIKEIRNKKGFTQQQVADALGTIRGQISKLEKKPYKGLNVLWLGKLAEVLGCHEFDLLLDNFTLIDEDITTIANMEGSIHSERAGVVEELDHDDKYETYLKKPRNLSNHTIRGFVVDGDYLKDFNAGSELFFAEITSPNDIKPNSHVLCEMQDAETGETYEVIRYLIINDKNLPMLNYRGKGIYASELFLPRGADVDDYIEVDGRISNLEKPGEPIIPLQSDTAKITGILVRVSEDVS